MSTEVLINQKRAMEEKFGREEDHWCYRHDTKEPLMRYFRDRRLHFMMRLLRRQLGGALALLMPSVWYETLGRTIVEAFAAGTPALVSRLGAMDELVDEGRTGWKFAPGDAAGLPACVRHMQGMPAADMNAMRRRARAEYETRFTPLHNYNRLVEIYDLARILAVRRRAGKLSIDSQVNIGVLSITRGHAELLQREGVS